MVRTLLRTGVVAMIGAAAIALAGCSGLSADWTKPGATRADIRADSATCRAEAEGLVGREADVTHDIRSGRRSGASDITALRNQTRDVGMERRYDDVFDRCMRAHGYTHEAQ